MKTQKGDPYIKIFRTLSGVRQLIFFALVQWNN